MTDELTALGGAVLNDVPEPPAIAELTRRSRRRRQRTASKVIAVAAAVVVLVVGVGLIRDRGHPAAATELIVTPVSGLRTGDRVDVAAPGDGRATADFVAQCPAEVIDLSYLDHVPDNELLPRCALVLTDPVLPSSLEVTAVIEGPDGAVDCRASDGRCVIAARTSDGLKWTPLRFAADESPGPLVLDSVVRLEGSRVAVSGSGVLAGEQLEILQCHDTEPIGWTCDGARNQSIVGDTNGRFHSELIVYQDIYSYGPSGPQWDPCQPCVISVRRRSDQQRPTTVPIPAQVPADPTRPTTTILDARRDGESIIFRLTGSGYQPNQRPSVGLCREPTPTDQASCTLPSQPSFAGGIVTNDNGTFESDWLLPAGAFITNGGDYCGTQQPPCVLGTQPGEGADLIAVAPVPTELP